jgi:hypothetical protein
VGHSWRPFIAKVGENAFLRGVLVACGVGELQDAPALVGQELAIGGAMARPPRVSDVNKLVIWWRGCHRGSLRNVSNVST